MCPDRLGIERLPEVSDECGRCVFLTTTKWKLTLKEEVLDPLQSKKKSIGGKSFYCAYVFFWMLLCYTATHVRKRPTVQGSGLSTLSLHLLLLWALRKLQCDFFPSLCHAPVSASLLCSALKAMCARSCSCGLPDVDQQGSNIFMVQSSGTCNSAAQNEEHKVIWWKLEPSNVVSSGQYWDFYICWQNMHIVCIYVHVL